VYRMAPKAAAAIVPMAYSAVGNYSIPACTPRHFQG
jgi:hypothetical protein